jgi:hypothetical protein
VQRAKPICSNAEEKAVRELGSKLLAGGLSAGVILLWWPHFFPGDSLSSWLVRGVAWTLSFELLLLAFGSFEKALWETAPAKGMQQKVTTARDRINAKTERRHLGVRGAIAAVALTIPLTLLATGVQDATFGKEPQPKVQRVTKVMKIVKVEQRTVRVPVAAGADTTNAQSMGAARQPVRSSAPAQAKRPVRKQASRRTSGNEAPRSQAREPVTAEPEATQPAPTTAPAPEQNAKPQSEAAPSPAAGVAG